MRSVLALWKPLVLLGVLVAGGLLVKSSFSNSWNSENKQFKDIVTEKVVRGPLRISITDRGQVDSMKSAILSSTVEGTTTIISIVPEGTIVQSPVRSEADGKVTQIKKPSDKETIITVQTPEGSLRDHIVPMGEHTQVRVKLDEEVKKEHMLAGDLICELDSSEMREQIKQQQIQLTQSEAALAQSIENLEIQKTQNESDIANAELQLTLAELDLKKYKEGEYLQQVNEIAGEVTLAQEEQVRAQEKYQFTKRISKKGYKSQNDLEADRIAVTKAEIALRVAQEKEKVLKTYTYKRTIAELEAQAKELALELERVKRKGISSLSQYEADVAARKLTAEVEKSKYERLLKQIDSCLLFAPQGGEAIYSNERSSRSSSENIIEEGASVRERQQIIKLPDLDHMKINAQIHESRVNQIKVGLQVIIRVDAYPDEVYYGEVDDISSVPSSTNWFNRDLKEYEGVIRLTEEGDKVRKLRPGLNASIEIVVKHREDVLQVPVQAVVTIIDKRYAWVMTEEGPERRDVLIGESNDLAIEILDGLQEGEDVILAPRSYFSDQIADLEAMLIEETENKQSGEKQGAQTSSTSQERSRLEQKKNRGANSPIGSPQQPNGKKRQPPNKPPQEERKQKPNASGQKRPKRPPNP